MKTCLFRENSQVWKLGIEVLLCSDRYVMIHSVRHGKNIASLSVSLVLQAQIDQVLYIFVETSYLLKSFVWKNTSILAVGTYEVISSLESSHFCVISLKCGHVQLWDCRCLKREPRSKLLQYLFLLECIHGRASFSGFGSIWVPAL
jgi:hypothetical protein